VHPSEVRLHPLEKDRYRWIFRDNNRHLFEKHLSDMSTSYYTELCDEVKKGNISATLIDMPVITREEAEKDLCPQQLEQDLQEMKETNAQLREEVNDLKIREASLRMHNRRLQKILSLLVGKATSLNQAVREGEVQIQRALNIMNGLNKESQGWGNLEKLLGRNP
jgi:flagellar motor switch protein FliM